MKKLICAMLVAAASAAFAEGDDNIALLVSTAGPDCYLGGEVVMDGECYALVWSRDGVFEGFTADGAPIDTNDFVVNVGSVARNGRCKAAFEVSATLASELENGVYSVYVLDTRVTDGGVTKPRGLVDGKLAVLNGYGKVAEGVTVSVGSGLAVANETQPAGGTRDGKRAITVVSPAPDVRQPKITRIATEDGDMVLYVENLKGYMRVKTGKDLSLSDGVTPAVQADGSADEVRIVVPKSGNSGFYKVIRNWLRIFHERHSRQIQIQARRHRHPGGRPVQLHKGRNLIRPHKERRATPDNMRDQQSDRPHIRQGPPRNRKPGEGGICPLQTACRHRCLAA